MYMYMYIHVHGMAQIRILKEDLLMNYVLTAMYVVMLSLESYTQLYTCSPCAFGPEQNCVCTQ